MKNKLNLKSLEVKSFVTKMDEVNAQTLNGGSSGISLRPNLECNTLSDRYRCVVPQ